MLKPFVYEAVLLYILYHSVIAWDHQERAKRITYDWFGLRVGRSVVQLASAGQGNWAMSIRLWSSMDRNALAGLNISGLLCFMLRRFRWRSNLEASPDLLRAPVTLHQGLGALHMIASRRVLANVCCSGRKLHAALCLNCLDTSILSSSSSSTADLIQ
jgi:hypothetical protein